MNKILESHKTIPVGTMVVHKINRKKKKKITGGPIFNEKNGTIEYFAHNNKFDKLINIDHYEILEEEKK